MSEYIWIKTKCNNYYKLFDKIKNIGIEFYESIIEDKTVYLKIKNKDLKKLRKYIVSYRFKVHKKIGIFNIISLMKNNMLYAVVIFLSLLLFLFLKNIIVDVDVMHSNKDLVRLIEKELINYNVKPLTMIKSYDYLSNVKEKILEEYPDKIDWIEIEVVGMKYVVKFEERIITEEMQEEDYCNVFAKEDGMITSLSIKEGVAVVNIGDYVKKGDLLISGDIMLNDKIVSNVCAKGDVKAEKWYEVNLSVPYNYFTLEKTGKNRINFFIEHENKETKIFKDRIDTYVSEEVLIFDLLGYKLYLENQYETKKINENYSEKEALEKAMILAEEKMKLKLDANEQIISKNVLKKSENNSTIEVEIFITTIESIS